MRYLLGSALLKPAQPCPFPTVEIMKLEANAKCRKCGAPRLTTAEESKLLEAMLEHIEEAEKVANTLDAQFENIMATIAKLDVSDE